MPHSETERSPEMANHSRRPTKDKIIPTTFDDSPRLHAQQFAPMLLCPFYRRAFYATHTDVHFISIDVRKLLYTAFIKSESFLIF